MSKMKGLANTADLLIISVKLPFIHTHNNNGNMGRNKIMICLVKMDHVSQKPARTRYCQCRLTACCERKYIDTIIDEAAKLSESIVWSQIETNELHAYNVAVNRNAHR